MSSISTNRSYTTFPLTHLMDQLMQEGRDPVTLAPRVLKMILILVANQDRIMQQYAGHIEIHFAANDIQAKISESLKKGKGAHKH